MADFDLDLYLNRIGLSDVPRTADGLRMVQQAQCRAFPFESIDPFLGITPNLSTEALCEKILHGGRGGYCFELNTLLGLALKAIGFDVQRSLGRVRRTSPLGGPRSHLVLRVSIGERVWLADAGFGGPGALVPLQIGPSGDQCAPNGTYRLRSDRITGERVLQKKAEPGWTALYAFDEAYVGDPDVAGANHLCATWSDLPFSDHLMLAGFDGDTRIGVFDRNVTTERGGKEERSILRTLEEFSTLLANRLNLHLSRELEEAIWTRLKTT